MTSDASNISAPELVGWTAGPDTRGTLTLVWSCLITIFACTWTVLHLNVPGRDEGSFTILLRKIKWMAINVIFPEFIFAKGVCDLRLALEELREFDNNVRDNNVLLRKWTTQSREGRDLRIHEWLWQFEYPPMAHWLYRVLHLKPPRPPFRQKLLFHAKADSPDNQRNMEAQPQFDNSCDNSSKAKNSPSNQEQVKNTQRGPDSISPEEGADMKDGQCKMPKETSSVVSRTVQKWTVVHSYYAQMGGILCYHPHEPEQHATSPPRYYCFTASMLATHCPFQSENDYHLFDHLVLSEEDIKDKSKADWLLKGIAVAQVSWLILSVIVRSIRDLPITQLEVGTISFAVMAVLSYAANWWKPKDVSRATILHTPIGSDPYRRKDKALPRSFMARLLAARRRGAKKRYQRVSNDKVWMERDTPLLFTLMAIFSLGFGGLHCLAWNYNFPTRVEIMCWRIASVISAGLPALTLGINLVLSFFATDFTNRKLLSTLLRKLEPLNGLPSDFWALIKEPNWDSFYTDAQSFLGKSQIGRRDRAKESMAPRLNENDRDVQPKPDDGLHYACQHFILHFKGFIDHWGKAQGLTLRAASTSLFEWRHTGSMMQSLSQEDRLLDLCQDYEGFIRGKHGIDISNIPDPSCIAFVLRVFGETSEEFPRWEKSRIAFARATFYLTIISSVIYAIARLAILVLLFTSLRETPAGVYQVTPWVNFLPNFS